MYPRMALQLNTSPRSYRFYKKCSSGPRPGCAPRMRRQCHSILTPFPPRATASAPLPKSRTSFGVGNRYDQHAVLDNSVHDAKREPPDGAFAMHIVDTCKFPGVKRNLEQRGIYGTSKPDSGPRASLGIPIKRLVEIAACTAQVFNGAHLGSSRRCDATPRL